MFMKNEKIKEFGISRAGQFSLHFVEGGSARKSGYYSSDVSISCITNSGVPICSAGQSKHSSHFYSRDFCCFYCKDAAQHYRENQKFCKLKRDDNQQSSQNCAGGFSGTKGSWPKNKGKLKYPIAMTGCVSKSLHRFTTFLSLLMMSMLPPIIFLNY